MTKGKARAVADAAEGTILATVTIEVPPERVFRAITTDEITAWWGSDDTYRVSAYSADLVVGGSWRSEGIGRDGTPFAVGGTFLEIDPPRKLVQTWVAPWDGNAVTTLTWRLDPAGSGTVLTLRHEGFVGRPDSCRNHADGWTRVLGWLARHAIGGEAPRYFLCRLIAPRPTFAFDMTPEEKAVMAAHAGYWTDRLGAGEAVLFGPVADPAGPWGLGIVRAPDAGAVEAFTAADPAMLSDRGFRYEIMPMLSAVVAG